MNRFPEFKADGFANITRKDLELSGEARAATDNAAKEAAIFLAKKLDETILGFCASVACRPISAPEIMHEGRLLKLRTHSQTEPNDWENFFIFRRRVLAYRYLTGSHVNENNHAMILDYTFQSTEILEADWPDAVKRFMAEPNA